MEDGEMSDRTTYDDKLLPPDYYRHVSQQCQNFTVSYDFVERRVVDPWSFEGSINPTTPVKQQFIAGLMPYVSSNIRLEGRKLVATVETANGDGDGRFCVKLPSFVGNNDEQDDQDDQMATTSFADDAETQGETSAS